MAKTARKKPVIQEVGPGNNHIEDVAHEEVPIIDKPSTTGEVVHILTIDQQISRELARFSPADAGISKLKEQYGALKITSQDDKAGYKAVKEAWNIVRSTRTGFEKKGKDLRSDYTVITKAISKEEDRLVELITPLEDDLYKKWKAIDDEKERVKREAEEAEQAQLMKRVEEIQILGMTFVDGFYQIGGTISVDVASLRGFNEDQYSKLKGAIQAKKAELDKAEADRLEQKRKDDERLQKEQDDLKRQQDDLKKQQDDLRKQQEQLKRDQEAAAKIKRDNRINKLVDMGMTYNERQDMLEFDNGFKSVTHSGAMLFEMDDYGFDEHTKILADLIKESKDSKAKHYQELERLRIDTENHKKFIAASMDRAGFSFSYTNQSFFWEDKNTAIEISFSELIRLDESQVSEKAQAYGIKIQEAKKLTADKDKAEKEAADKEAKLALSDRDRFFADVAGIEAILTEIKPDDYKTKKFQGVAAKLKADIVNILNAVK